MTNNPFPVKNEPRNSLMDKSSVAQQASNSQCLQFSGNSLGNYQPVPVHKPQPIHAAAIDKLYLERMMGLDKGLEYGQFEPSNEPSASAKTGDLPVFEDIKEKNKKRPLGKSRLDSDLELLLRNVDDKSSLKPLALTIRQASNNQVKRSVPQKRSNEPSNSQQLSKEQFNSILLSLSKSKRLQLFGMSWLKKACKASPEGQIPRDKIFARYVTVCADHGISSLSSALFGRLIRVAFPNITVHRYGNRGQSKYHYCGIVMAESANPRSGSATPTSYLARPSVFSDLSNSEVSSPLRSVFDADSSVNSPIYSATELSPVSASSYHTNRDNNQATADLGATKVASFNIDKYCGEFTFRFHPGLLPSFDSFTKKDVLNLIIDLPSIEPYLANSPAYNKDIATTLFSLYKSSCTAIFESVRYMKVKDLMVHINSFPRSLSNQVFLLFISEPVLPWIIKCDLILYETILKMLFKLILNVSNKYASGDVFKHLRDIAETVPCLMSESYTSFPSKMRMAKQNLGTKFCKLVGKIADICEKGSSVTEIFVDESISNALLQTWSTVDVQSLFSRQYLLSGFQKKYPMAGANLVKAFTVDILDLIRKSNVESGVPVDRIFMMWLNYFSSLSCHLTGSINESISETPVSPELFLLNLNCLFDSILQEILAHGPTGFPYAWSLKSWIFEWLNWYGELSGLLSLNSNLLDGDITSLNELQPHQESGSTDNSALGLTNNMSTGNSFYNSTIISDAPKIDQDQSVLMPSRKRRREDEFYGFGGGERGGGSNNISIANENLNDSQNIDLVSGLLGSQNNLEFF